MFTKILLPFYNLLHLGYGFKSYEIKNHFSSFCYAIQNQKSTNFFLKITRIDESGAVFLKHRLKVIQKIINK